MKATGQARQHFEALSFLGWRQDGGVCVRFRVPSARRSHRVHGVGAGATKRLPFRLEKDTLLRTEGEKRSGFPFAPALPVFKEC